ncbi:hypothetical protein GCM10010129_83720 [Streptomyces fumigatiscleroticus]|nr:hypothetical protein GCM10010129_83720 [Streptomyces fumigatiscleroticus]
MPDFASSARPPAGPDAARAAGDDPSGGLWQCRAAVDVVPDGDRIRLLVRGELDVGGRRLKPALNQALRRAGSGLDLDMDRVHFCDCAGLNILLDLRLAALDQEKTVTIGSAAPAVVRLLELTEVRALFVPPGPGDGPLPAGGRPPTDAEQHMSAELGRLRRALRTRPVIDLARGILMATFDLTSEAAWSVLAATSRHTDIAVHRLARDLIDTVNGTPLPGRVQEQLVAAVARAKNAPAAPPGAP